MRRIAVLNQKGGVGKTTTVANLAAALARSGQRVLVVDLDPQANLTLHLGVDPSDLELSVYDLMRDECAGYEVIKDTCVEGLELVPATIDLAGLEVELSQADGREALLRERLEPLVGDYEWVFVDCPPSLGLLTLNALVAAREVLIALQTEFFALQGVSRLLQTVELVRERLNAGLKVGGVLACMYDHRTSLSRAVLDDIRGYFGDKVFRTVIRKNVRLAEAPSFGLPITVYDEKSYGAQDYLSLARELLGVAPPVPPPLPEQLRDAGGLPGEDEPPAVPEMPERPEPAPADPAIVSVTEIVPVATDPLKDWPPALPNVVAGAAEGGGQPPVTTDETGGESAESAEQPGAWGI
jgi:chromosome partitioning protein